MNESQLRDRLLELFPPGSDGDWDEILRRSALPRRSLRRLSLVVAAALLAVLAVGSALAVSGRLGSLFHGTPVKDLTPRERFVLSELDASGKVELLAKQGSRAFYVIRRGDGRRCYAIGDIRTGLTPAQAELNTRFSSISCIDPKVFPSRALPVLNSSSYMLRSAEKEARLTGLRGFAADPVARIGVIGRDNRIVFSVEVTDNVYDAGRKSIAGARGVVALDENGKPLWVQCTAIGTARPDRRLPHGGCGKYKNSPPPPQIPPSIRPTRPAPPSGPIVVQHGNANGVSVVVRGSKIEARFDDISPQTRELLEGKRGRINLGCFKLVKVGGRWYTQGGAVTKDFSIVTRVRFFGRDRAFAAPFDGCTATGMYGHTWNDAHGTHDAVEIPLTPRGRRHFAERAVARDLAWLGRSRVFKAVRYAQRPLTSESAAAYLADRVDPLAGPADSPPVGRLGIWLGPDRRIVLVERAPTGRRLYLEFRRGLLYRTNLIGFASTF